MGFLMEVDWDATGSMVFFIVVFFCDGVFRCPKKNELEDAKIARDLRFVDIFLGLGKVW
jgi:hypothetical protein